MSDKTDGNKDLIQVTYYLAGETAESRKVPKGITLKEFTELVYAPETAVRILLGNVNGRIMELMAPLMKDSRVRFLTIKDKPGYQTYERSLVFLMLKAIHDVVGEPKLKRVKVDYSLGDALFCRAEGDFTTDEAFLQKIEDSMRRLVSLKVPFNSRTVVTEEAEELFRRYGLMDKASLFRFRRTSHVNLYSIKRYSDYFYGQMLPDTSYLTEFALKRLSDGFLLCLPPRNGNGKVGEITYSEKVFAVLHRNSEEIEKRGVSTVNAVNELISEGHVKEMVLSHEALMEKQIGDIAQMIASKKDIRLILVAGPSSSGKTTFSNRLRTQLIAQGLKPYAIEVDNYFKNREDTPKDEKGEYDFECLEALDVKQFNEDVLKLLAGEEVPMPTFDFRKGQRTYEGNTMRLGEGTVLIAEGIHCLNEKLSAQIPAENKFKIYISCLTQINVDDHNRIPTTDARLLRRIVRDARTRGYGARETIRRWQSVSDGAQKYIFPFQDSADVVFNSALIYETSVLKPYVEPLLFGIRPSDREFEEASRLLKFLDYFLTIPADLIPQTSIIREFIGGSCYKS